MFAGKRRGAPSFRSLGFPAVAQPKQGPTEGDWDLLGRVQPSAAVPAFSCTTKMEGILCAQAGFLALTKLRELCVRKPDVLR